MIKSSLFLVVGLGLDADAAPMGARGLRVAGTDLVMDLSLGQQAIEMTLFCFGDAQPTLRRRV